MCLLAGAFYAFIALEVFSVYETLNVWNCNMWIYSACSYKLLTTVLSIDKNESNSCDVRVC